MFRRSPRSPRCRPPTNCWPAPTRWSPNAHGLAKLYAAPDLPCRRHRRISSGCRWESGRWTLWRRPPTHASWSARTALTVSGPPSAPRRKTTPCCNSRRAGIRPVKMRAERRPEQRPGENRAIGSKETAMSDALARKKFTEFKERTDAIADAELDDYWASLRPATIDGMLGEWKGGEFVTGHRMNGQLEKARWFGK